MMSAGVIKLAFMLTRPARTRIGPLLAALVILLAANAAVRAWRSLEQAETRQSYNRLSKETELVAQHLSSLEKNLLELEGELETGRRLIEALDLEIREKHGKERLEALSKRESFVKLYHFQAEDYRNLYRKYEKTISDLQVRYESLNRLADELDLPYQEIPVKTGSRSPLRNSD